MPMISFFGVRAETGPRKSKIDDPPQKIDVQTSKNHQHKRRTFNKILQYTYVKKNNRFGARNPFYISNFGF